MARRPIKVFWKLVGKYLHFKLNKNSNVRLQELKSSCLFLILECAEGEAAF